MGEDIFYFENGVKAGSVFEFKAVLDNLSEREFHKYVTDEKNDFCAWLESSLGEPELADKLKSIKDLQEMKKALYDYFNPEKETAKEELIVEKEEPKEPIVEKEPVREEPIVEKKIVEKKSTSDKDEIEKEVNDLMSKNKEITAAIKAEKTNLKEMPKFAGHTISHGFSKEHIRHLLIGFGFGLIVGVIIMFVLVSMGVIV